MRRLFLCLLLLLVGFGHPGCGGPSSTQTAADDPSFAWFEDTVLKSDKVVVVDFTATWCGYCQQLKTHLHRLEKGYGDRIKVIAVDIDEYPALKSRFRIGPVPHLILFSNGEVLANPGSGAPPTYEDLEAMVTQWLPAEKQTASR